MNDLEKFNDLIKHRNSSLWPNINTLVSKLHDIEIEVCLRMPIVEAADDPHINVNKANSNGDTFSYSTGAAEINQ